MRVLTVRQPWAWAIIFGGKSVENRTRNIAGDYRGPVAIHVALQFADLGGESWNRRIAAEVGRLSRAGLPGNERVVSHIANEDHPKHHVHRRYGHRGAVIGVVELTDVHNHEEPRPRSPMRVARTTCSEWAMDSHHHLMLANPRPIDPIPAKGRLGLWRPDPELQAQIEAALS